MSTAREFWRPIVNDFNPVPPLRPADVARIYVDRKADDPSRSALQLFTVSLQNNLAEPRPYKALLTGHIGSGKSSELVCLSEKLAGDFFVVRFDAEVTLVPETANHFDVLLGMGLTVHATAAAAGLYPDKRLADSLVKSLAKFVRKYEDRKGFALRLDQLLKLVTTTVLVSVQVV